MQKKQKRKRIKKKNRKNNKNLIITFDRNNLYIFVFKTVMYVLVWEYI